MTTNSERRRPNNDRLDRLRESIEAGVADLDRGDYIDVEDADLDAYLDSLAASESR